MPPRPPPRHEAVVATIAGLSADTRAILWLKAMIGWKVNKTQFLSVANAARLSNPKGGLWTYTTLAAVFRALESARLLTVEHELPAHLWHLVTVEAFKSLEAPILLKAILDVLPAETVSGDGYKQYNNRPQVDPYFLRRMRLALYANDVEVFRQLLETYSKTFTPALGRSVFEILFEATVVELSWLKTLNPEIQFTVFAVKLHQFLETGLVTRDFGDMLAYARSRRDDPDYHSFTVALLGVDILSGYLAAATKTLDRLEKAADDSMALLLRGSIAFLADRNEDAIDVYSQALKLHRKETGRRKIFFTGSNGILFLMALLRTDDPSVRGDIQAHLDAVLEVNSVCKRGFEALQALLWLIEGKEAKARAKIAAAGAQTSPDPFSAAVIALVEFLIDPKLAEKRKEENAARFHTYQEVMPLVARIHAEVLNASLPQPELFWQNAVAAVAPDVTISFLEIVPLQQPWERTLDTLNRILLTGSAAPTVPRTTKNKRLAWYIDPVGQTVEAVEQTAKGREGWTPGRTVARKRLHDQDSKLDYLTDHDRRALAGLYRTSEYRGWNAETYDFDFYRTVLALIGHPLVFDARQRSHRVDLVPYPVELVVTEKKGAYHLTLSHSATTPALFLEPETPSRWRVIDFSKRLHEVREVLGEELVVPARGREQVLELIKEQIPDLAVRAEIAEADLPATEGQSTPVLQIAPLDDGLKVEMVVRPFGPGGPFYIPGQGGRSVLALIDGVRQRAVRDLAAETESSDLVRKALPTLHRIASGGHEWVVGDPETALEFLLEVRECPHPVIVEWPEGQRLTVHRQTSNADLSLKLTHARDWFRVDGEVRVDEDLVLDMRDLLDRLASARGRFVPLADGSFIALTRQFQKQLERLRGVTEEDAKGRRLPMLGAVAIQDIVETAGTLKADSRWKAFASRLRAADSTVPEIPSTLRADLRDYQTDGFRWLSRLANWEAGACLADDMGLGKTVQAIAAMLEQAPHGPCLVIAPTSVCHNWEHELERFAPTLAVHRLGAQANRADHIGGLGKMDVMIASYGLLNQESDRLSDVEWRMVVFDEAQAIKNAETKRAQAGQRLKARFRVALTGTPIENYLDELWSLFNIVNPGLLGSRESFASRFATPIERNRSDAALQALRALIRPFILRRTKAAVLSELPPRTEVTIEIDLPDDERAFYEALRRRALETLAQLKETGASGQTRIHILAEITRLRRACCNPALVEPGTELAGAKLAAFIDLVNDLIRNRHKALVFSQFVGQLEKVREALDGRGISYQYLDGRTPPKERERCVAAFQAGEGELFLISLRAGGTGLNLTAADYVIHLDPWWNPAVEDQASDRAHRIGQQRPVTVYRLIVRDSIEQGILDLHQRKRDLASDLLEGSEISARLSDEDLLNLIRQ